MTVLLDASVALRWFVDQPGREAAASWLVRFVHEPELLIAPDLLRFEVYGALARLQQRQEPGWAERCFRRLDALGIRTLPTTRALFDRGHALARSLRVGGYDALYLAHAEALGIRWLTADERAVRQLGEDPRVQRLDSP